MLGVGGEYDTIGNAHWDLASASAAFSSGSPANRWTVAADGRFGGGDIGTQRFDYDVEAVRFTDTVDRFVSLDLESRQFDVYTTHGNLPKAGLSLFMAGHWILGVAYAHSTGGNLGTVYTSARLDHLGGRSDGSSAVPRATSPRPCSTYRPAQRERSLDTGTATRASRRRS